VENVSILIGLEMNKILSLNTGEKFGCIGTIGWTRSRSPASLLTSSFPLFPSDLFQIILRVIKVCVRRAKHGAD
jgi:hypothetical protein